MLINIILRINFTNLYGNKLENTQRKKYISLCGTYFVKGGK